MAKRILYIVGEYPSVTETFVQREIEGLRERGMSIKVCPLDGLGPGKLVSAALRAPWQLYGLLYRHTRELDSCTWRSRIGSAVKALVIAREYPRVEHLHAHFLGAPALTAYYLSRVLHISYSVTAHAHDIYAETTPSLVLTEASFRTTCTESNVKFLAQKGPFAPFALVRHGIDARRYAGVRTSDPGLCRLLAVGRHVEKKGFRYLIEACALLRASGFSYHCKIIGEGPLLEQCSRRALAIGLENTIEFGRCLPHNELQRMYLNSDVLVVPSVLAANGDRDGVPNVILEAMAAGLPVIASDAGAICEVIENYQTGILVPQRNPDAIADAIVEFWSDESLRNTLTASTFSFVRSEFDSEYWFGILEKEFLGVFGTVELKNCEGNPVETSQQRQRERMIAKYSSEDEFRFWEGYTKHGLTSYEKRAFNQNLERDSRVLDIGCGCGREALYLASHGVDFCAIDTVPRMVEHTKQRLEMLGCSAQVLCADICDGVPFEGQFDIILLLEQVYQQIPRREERLRALSNVRDRMSGHGAVMLTVFNEGDINLGHRLTWLWNTNFELARSAVVDGVSLLDLRYLSSNETGPGGEGLTLTHWQRLRILRWTAAYLVHVARRKFNAKLRRYLAHDKDRARCKRISRANPIKESDGYFLFPVLALHEVTEELDVAGFEISDVHALLEGGVSLSRRAKYGAPLCLIVAKAKCTSTL